MTGTRPPDGSRIPSLGSRGQGWVLLQFVALGVAFVGSWRTRGPADGALQVAVVALGSALIALGVAVLVLGFRNLGHSLSVMPKPLDTGTLVVSGIYEHIRHPFYVGLMLVMVGFAVAMDSTIGLLLCVFLVVVLDLKARREEVWLRERYPDYVYYAQRTKRFVPYVY